MSRAHAGAGGAGAGAHPDIPNDVDDDPRKLKFFPVERLAPLKRVLILGTTMCGKTTALHNIVYQMHVQGKKKNGVGIQVAIGFSNTERANGNLGGPIKDNDGNVTSKYALIPKWCAHHGFDEALLREFMDYQIMTKEAGRGKTSLVIFDDLLSQKGLKNNSTINECLQNSRNYKTGVVVSAHGPKQLCGDSRGQFHFAFIYGLPNDQMKGFYDSFASKAFASFKAFDSTWRRISKDLGQYWCMVIDLSAGGELNNRVFKYRAPNPASPTYRTPHVCEAGMWWIQSHLRKKEEKKDLSNLFNLMQLAQSRGVVVDDRAGGRKRGRDEMEEEDAEVVELFV